MSLSEILQVDHYMNPQKSINIATETDTVRKT